LIRTRLASPGKSSVAGFWKQGNASRQSGGVLRRRRHCRTALPWAESRDARGETPPLPCCSGHGPSRKHCPSRKSYSATESIAELKSK
jgi:hypothetical protein